MISLTPTRPTRRAILWLGCICVIAGALAGCDQTASQGGSGDETSTVAFYYGDGRPAANARVSVYGAADTGVAPRLQVVADAAGRVKVPTPGKGFFNLVARDQMGNALFQDSLYSNGGALPVASDTLRDTGSLTGRVQVPPQYSPRIAWLEVLGAGLYANVDDSGRFRLDGVPPGRFTIVAVTRDSNFTPTFVQVKAISDTTVDVGTIDLIFTGLPVVQGLQARFDTLAGLVYLKWDSIPLRQTWRYDVFRDDILLGQTVGPRWIDTVSGEYPANVPAQGKHTYRVSVANAQNVGPQWESITMQIISPLLYQEVKISWDKRSALPWTSEFYRIDTAGGTLVGWTSAEYGTKVLWPTESSPRVDDNVGWIQMWVSSDSGRTWNKNVDSLPLGALPVRYGGLWWSVRRGTGDLGSTPPDSFWGLGGSGIAYDSAIVVTSGDGSTWDSVGVVQAGQLLTNWRFERVGSGLDLVGGCTWSACSEKTINPYYTDIRSWKNNGSEFISLQTGDTAPAVGTGVGLWKRYWAGSWWDLSVLGTTVDLNGTNLPAGAVPNFTDLSYQALEMGYFALAEGVRTLLFGATWALSMDSTFTVLHTISWPGSGSHFEMTYGPGILSVSNAGVYVGTILPDSSSSPRGTWVAQTLVPSVF